MSGLEQPLREVTPPADHPVEVRRAAPADELKRTHFVRSHPDATFFHQRDWTRVVERVHGHRPHDLHAWRGEELVGVLPLMYCRGLSGRKTLVSTPYATYGGPLAADREAELALVAAAHDAGRELGVGHVELRYLDDPGLDLPGTDLYATFLRELPDDPAQILAGMPKKARAEARKARNRHALELAQGVWYVDDLSRLFLENKHMLGSPALPTEHFRTLLEVFPEDAYVHLVRHRGEPLAAVMSFGFRDSLIAYYAGTQPGADRAYSASNFMYMALQEWAVERGFRTFDFCRSRVDSGAFSFKRHQGFEPRPLNYRYDLIRRKSVPSFTPSNPRTAMLRRTWSKLPRWMARRLSDRLARYLP